MLIPPNLARRYGLVSCRSAGESETCRKIAPLHRGVLVLDALQKSPCQGSRDRAKATTAINAAVASGALAIAQVGLRAFGPRSKSAISLLRGDSAVAL